MRSPVQSRVPLLDKNKAFERLPLLGAFFFYTSLGAGDAIGDAKCKKLAPESLYSASGGYSI